MPRLLGSLLLVFLPLTVTASPQDVAKALRDHYRAGERDAADALIAAQPVAHAWDDQQVVRVACTFRSRAEGLTVTVERRPGVRGPLVIALRPGVLAQPDRGRLKSSGVPQDLILLRAPVMELTSNTQRASVQVPVACASFRRKGPQPTQVYLPKRTRPGSALDRLARVLCAGQLPSTPETALAVWIAHEGLGAERLRRGSFRTFPTPREVVRPRHGAGAAKLLRRAKLQPESFPYFGGEARPEGKKAEPEAKSKRAEDGVSS